jgi:hypothetical protein
MIAPAVDGCNRMLGLGSWLPQFQERHIGLRVEPADVVYSFPQQTLDVSRRTVAQAKPYDLWWRSTQDTQAMKVLVLCHEHATVLHGQLPHDWIGRSAFAKETNMQATEERDPGAP